jgi:Flp pilus assembly protein TadB
MIWYLAAALVLIGTCALVRNVNSSRARAIVSTLEVRGGEIAEAPGRVKSQDTPRTAIPSQIRRIGWAVGAVLGVVVRVVVCGVTPVGVVGAVCVGILTAELFLGRLYERRRRRTLRQIEFYLPAVMERVVMAVSSGLDIIPALHEASRGGADPVSRLLARIVHLSERGTSVESAIALTVDSVEAISVKHAFIHVGLAYRQGGEIVRPLKELSDATHIAYQEGVEEVIAALPVKAIVPLVLTFTGLIISFLTVPLLQVGSIATKVTHASR